MATMNPFEILGDEDAEDPIQLMAAQQKAEKTQKAQASAVRPLKQATLPTKPPPPAQAVREARTEGSRGGGRSGGRGRGYGRGRAVGFTQDLANNENDNSNGFQGYKPSEDGEMGKPFERRGGYGGGPRGSFRGGRRGNLSNGEVTEGERPRRSYDRHSGTGRGNEIKRNGAGRANWGTPKDELAPSSEIEETANENEKSVSEKQPVEEGAAADVSKENPANETEEKDEDEKKMTLEEYEKQLEERRKALLALKTEERKVELDKEFEKMQQLSNKKENDDVFIKLGFEKEKRKEVEKEEKAKKSFSINEFLKPADGERYYYPTGRGRGRGRGSRGGGFSGSYANNAPAPSIEDPGQFPSLGGK